jgi:hypothetical protein
MRKGLASLILGTSLFTSPIVSAQNSENKYDVYAGFFKIGNIEGTKNHYKFDLGSLGEMEFDKFGKEYREIAKSKRGMETYIYSVHSDSLEFDNFYVDPKKWSRDKYLSERKDKLNNLGEVISPEFVSGLEFFSVFEKDSLPKEIKIMLFSHPHIAIRGDVKKDGDFYETTYNFLDGYICLPDKKYLNGPVNAKFKKENGKFEFEEMDAKILYDSFFGKMNINLKIKKE